MNINIKKYAVLLIMAMVTVSSYADYTNKHPVMKVYDVYGNCQIYYLSKVSDIYFLKYNKGLENLKSDLQTALSDTENSVVATSPSAYQYNNANSVDVFAGYMTVSRSDFQYSPALNNTYQWPNGYYGSACLAGPVELLYNAYTYAESYGMPEYKAIAQIVYGITALRAVNNAGCLPYHDLRNLKVSRPLTYLTQEETYNEILKDLDEAIATLKITQPNKVALMAVEGDAYDKGDATLAFSEYRWQKWVQLANTIKLRIAMYLAKPNEALAKQIATEALSDEIGVLDEDFGPAWKQGNTQHPIYRISASRDQGWADSRMSASAENILKRTGSPLKSRFFTKNIGVISGIGTGADKGKGAKKDANYYGIRQGTNVGIKTIGEGYYNFSEVAPSFKYVRQVWVSKEEAIFLKAEYALRWGEDADAKNLYEQGIRSALAKYEVAGEADKYLAQTSVVQEKVAGKAQDIDYIDPYNNKNSLPGRLNICVKWDDSDSKEVKLEKLITQKWIAIFPNGQEAWTDYRRTGYPRLFPSVQAWQGSPSFPVELQLRRIPHDESDENIQLYDLPNIEQALTIFGVPGQNAGGQRLYFEGDPTIYPWTYDEVTGWPIPLNFVKSSDIEDEYEELPTETTFKLYPSQMRDHLTIEGCKEGDRIMIVNMTGAIYYNNICDSEKLTIDVASYPAGLYIVSVGENVRKVIKID